ncbi:hypothetical protein [Streptomyces lasiicapitis]|uniref:hypothetical protein n=1 Tax=Streptomyces lasiicapitis TaxID=1923961 RepID=UPI00364D6CE6
MIRVPCGCRAEINARGDATGFSQECEGAHQLFTRLIQADGRAQQEAVAAELTQHVVSQL